MTSSDHIPDHGPAVDHAADRCRAGAVVRSSTPPAPTAALVVQALAAAGIEPLTRALTAGTAAGPVGLWRTAIRAFPDGYRVTLHLPAGTAAELAAHRDDLAAALHRPPELLDVWPHHAAPAEVTLHILDRHDPTHPRP
jgi:hypothetical protein